MTKTTSGCSRLDYLTPHLNGLELYRRIRKVDSRIKCSIITSTQDRLTDDQDNPQRRDNLTVIRKPIGNEELLAKINSMLNQIPN